MLPPVAKSGSFCFIHDSTSPASAATISASSPGLLAPRLYRRRVVAQIARAQHEGAQPHLALLAVGVGPQILVVLVRGKAAEPLLLDQHAREPPQSPCGRVPFGWSIFTPPSGR
jgi:hypothetical protein